MYKTNKRGEKSAALKRSYGMSAHSSKLFNNLRSKVSDKHLLYCLFFLLHSHTHTHTGSTTSPCLSFYTLLPLSSLCLLAFQLPRTSVLHFSTLRSSLPVTFTAGEHKASLDTAIASKHLSLMLGIHVVNLSWGMGIVQPRALRTETHLPFCISETWIAQVQTHGLSWLWCFSILGITMCWHTNAHVYNIQLRHIRGWFCSEAFIHSFTCSIWRHCRWSTC